MMSAFWRVTCVENFANESSDTSHSRLKVKRAKISCSSGISQVCSMPSACTAPVRKSRKWS